MATESIGALIPTAIPGYADAADIQAALRAYHYGSYSYDPANTSATSLVANSIAKYIYDIEQDIIDLENRPSSGGEVDPTEPAPGDFTPPGIPDGFIWVDENGTLGGGPTSATSIFTNSAPTSSLTTGLIWVDKDADSITDNPFIPQSVIAAKGDLIVGLANDSAGILSTASTNGYVLSVNSSTTSGLEWILPNPGDITGVTAGTGLSGGGTSGTVTLSLADSPTLNYPVLVAPDERWSVSATAATGTVNLDVLTSGILYYTSDATGNWTLNVRGSSTTSLNSILTTNDSITVVFFVTNGGTAYYQTALNIDGSAVTPKWQNGVAPSAGNTNSIDIYSFTIVKTGSAAFTAFGSQTKFA
jgi:hypothetical protein